MLARPGSRIDEREHISGRSIGPESRRPARAVDEFLADAVHPQMAALYADVTADLSPRPPRPSTISPVDRRRPFRIPRPRTGSVAAVATTALPVSPGRARRHESDGRNAVSAPLAKHGDHCRRACSAVAGQSSGSRAEALCRSEVAARYFLAIEYGYDVLTGSGWASRGRHRSFSATRDRFRYRPSTGRDGCTAVHHPLDSA